MLHSLFEKFIGSNSVHRTQDPLRVYVLSSKLLGDKFFEQRDIKHDVIIRHFNLCTLQCILVHQSYTFESDLLGIFFKISPFYPRRSRTPKNGSEIHAFVRTTFFSSPSIFRKPTKFFFSAFACLTFPLNFFWSIFLFSPIQLAL